MNLAKSLNDLMSQLAGLKDQAAIEARLKDAYSRFGDLKRPTSGNYYDELNYQLFEKICDHYKHGAKDICIWRFIKRLSTDQLQPESGHDDLDILSALTRTFFYSEPLDDLTCIFIPVNSQHLIEAYLSWIKSYFYNENYPTSLLWLYALDSSVSAFFPDEIVFIGRRASSASNILIPDFTYSDSVLIKRYSDNLAHYASANGKAACDEFALIFNALKEDYRDRCLSHSGRKEDFVSEESYRAEWEKFSEVLEFGVSDRYETGCVSFSDLRNSTSFLNQYGKNVFRNTIQQPFFEKTDLISKRFHGRIDKFMGDNVMCAFLRHSDNQDLDEAIETILNNFCALFELCRVLMSLLNEAGLGGSGLGLRSGVSYGNEILRSNLGNELVRDFTVTGETVNFAARLEHFSVQELMTHNEKYFEEIIQRFPAISELASVVKSADMFSAETRQIIDRYTQFQNIVSNLLHLEKVRFDIRCNDIFYIKLREFFLEKNYKLMNEGQSDLFGYEEFQMEEHVLRFYYSFFNPKGFTRFEKIWILPLSEELLGSFNLKLLR